MSKRVCILGTAPSWRQCPFDDPTLEIWALNDAWTMGIPRVDRWFELHPLDHLHFRPVGQRVVYAEDVPHGYYVRPQGHLEKLQEMARTIPVYLQSAPPQGWPVNAHQLDKAAIEAALAQKLGDAVPFQYWASGPSYEIALAILEGYTEIQVWGIHLETEAEYREQRPNFEHLLGIARGLGIKVVMAPSSPLLKHGWQYAYQPKPTPHPAKALLRRVQHDKSKVLGALAGLKRWQPRAHLVDQAHRLEARERDCFRALQYRAPVVIQAGV